jgi:hypothetical protein
MLGNVAMEIKGKSLESYYCQGRFVTFDDDDDDLMGERRRGRDVSVVTVCVNATVTIAKAGRR